MRQASIGRLSASLLGKSHISLSSRRVAHCLPIGIFPRVGLFGDSPRFIGNTSIISYSTTTTKFAYNAIFEDAEPIISQEEAEKMLATWAATYHQPINIIVAAILQDKTYRTYINAQALDFVNWENFVNAKRRALIANPVSVLGSHDEVARFKELLDEAFHEVDFTKIQSMNKTSSSFLYCKQMVFDLFLKQGEVYLKEVIDTNKVLAMTSDLRIPHEWFPHARIMKRKIFYHGGPTNSGKVCNQPFLYVHLFSSNCTNFL
jgi:hypothetical protein